MTTFDRVAMAFLGVVVGALTLLAYGAVAFFLTRPQAAPVLWALFLSPLGLAFVIGCGLAGAFLPGERFADLFAILWGNHGFWDSRRGRWTAVAVAITLGVALLLLGDIGSG